MWRAVSGWLEEIVLRFGSPVRLAGSGCAAAGLRPRLAALEALVRCLVLEAARRLAPSLTAGARTGTTDSGPGSGLRDEEAGTGASGARPTPEAAAPAADPADPSTWRVGFAWSAVAAPPPRPFPDLGPKPVAPRITVLEVSEGWTFFRLGPAKPVRKPAPPPVFTGRFGSGPTPAWEYFPPADVSGDDDGPEIGPLAISNRARRGKSAPAPGDASPARAWLLAARLEAARRIILDPAPHVRRIALRLAAELRTAASGPAGSRSVTLPPRPLWGSWRRKSRLPPDLRSLLLDAESAWDGLCLARRDSS